MNLYRISPNQPFLPIVADFIISNFRSNMDHLKVVLPCGVACLNLQKILVAKAGATILPNIVPFADIAAESEEIFKIPSENIGILSYLEEKIILAEIIHDYKKLSKGLEFSLRQSLKFSSQLARLFYELATNNIPIESINELPTINQAEHWQFIYQFLNYAHQEWQKRVAASKKLDKATHRANSLEAEVRRIKQDNTSSLIVAGIFGHDSISWHFLKNIASLSSGFIILPPLADFSSLLTKNQIAEEDTLYCLQQLLKMLGKNLADFKLLGSYHEQRNILDNLIDHEFSLSEYAQLANKIEYREFTDIFAEAEAISLICQQHQDKKIAIVLNNRKNKEFYCNFLINSFSFEFQDLLGCDLLKTNVINLLIAVSEVVCSSFELKKLFILLKNPLINSHYTVKLEQLLLGKSRFIASYEELLKLLEKTANQQLSEWGRNVLNLLSEASMLKENSFNIILTTTITVAEKLCPNIWLDQRAVEASELLGELIKLNWHCQLESIEDFPSILKSVIAGASYFDNSNNSANIIICKPEDAWVMQFDLVILADFSEGNWPTSPPVSPWLNKQMQQALELHSQQIHRGLSLYYFYLLLHNDRVIVTRSKKQSSGEELLPSSYMLKLQTSHPELVSGSRQGYVRCRNKFGMTNTANSHPEPTSHPELVSGSGQDYTRCRNEFGMTDPAIGCPFFPNRLSVSDIEMLIRNPYGFYAKKILGLRKQDTIAAAPKLSEFGTFVHDAIEQYSNSYNKTVVEKTKQLIDIGCNVLDQAVLPMATKKIWQTKFATIAEEFIKFDEQRRTNCQFIYSELQGGMLLDIAGQEITITAKADRIEIDRENRAVIIDYKTGSIPTRKEILTGLSPQLIVEALIALAGGFKTKITGVESLIYVKIASSKPYIQLTEIKLTSEELQQHRQGLKNLLEYYVIHKEFSLNVDLLKYNDYKHLARKL